MKIGAKRLVKLVPPALKLRRAGKYYTIIIIIVFVGVSLFKIFLYNQTPTKTKDGICEFYSESAFHYHYARMVAENEKIPSIDYRAQYPEGFTVFSQIYLPMVYLPGYLYRAVSIFINIPFHRFLIYFIAFFSSLSVFAIFLLTRELTKNKIAATIAAAFYGFSIASFMRTIGNFLREDFGLPFIFFSFYFLIKSLNGKKSFSYAVISGVFLFAAQTCWPFTQFYFLLVLTYVIFEFILSRYKKDNLLSRNFIILLFFNFLAGLLIPYLRAEMMLISLPMLLSYTFMIVFLLNSYSNINRWIQLAIFPAVGLTLQIAVQYYLKSKNLVVHSHVYDLMLSKLTYLFRRPSNPLLLSPEVREYWIGANNNPTFGEILDLFSPLLLVIGISSFFWELRNFFVKKTTRPMKILLYFTVVFSVLFLVIKRLFVLFAFVLPFFVGKTITNFNFKRSRIFFIAVSVILCLCFLSEFRKSAKSQQTFHVRRTDIEADRDIVSWINKNTEHDDAILTSFPIEAMVLAYTGRRIIIHPVYETELIRKKIQEFITALYENEETFYIFCKKYGIDYFLYHTVMVLASSTDASLLYKAGKMKLEKSAAAYKFHFQPENLRYFELVYQNSTYRMFRLRERAKEREGKYWVNYYAVYDRMLFEDGKKDRYFDNAGAQEVLSKIELAVSFNNQGLGYLNKDMKPQALEVIRKSIEILPLLEGYFNLGLFHYDNGMLDEAKNYFEKALKRCPKYVRTYIDLNYFSGLIHKKKGEDQKAIIQFENVLLLDPNSVEAHYSLGTVYLRTGKAEEAKKEWRKCLELNPRFKLAQEALRK